MRRERRLVHRVLRVWKEMAQGRRFPRRDQIEPAMLAEDWANCLVIAVQPPVRPLHFFAVGDNLLAAHGETPARGIPGLLSWRLVFGGKSADSPLEEDGFEPSVPRQIRCRFQDGRPVSRDGLTVSRPGTRSSNPSPSSRQSVSHGKSRVAVENPGCSRGCAGHGRRCGPQRRG
jgi:hypothetical protein